MKLKRYTVVILLLFIGFIYAGGVEQKSFYVSTTGSDNNDGSINSPFATIEKARDVIRAEKKNSALTAYTVYLREGIYHISKTIEFDDRDAARDEAPTIIKAYDSETVRISGGISIKPEWIGKVADTTVSERFITRAKDKILQIDYSSFNTNEGEIVPRGFGRPVSVIQMELFAKDKAYFLARYPNSGFEHIVKVINKGSVPSGGDLSGKGGTIEYTAPRIDRWSMAEDAWIGGYFGYGFADDAVAVKKVDGKRNRITTKQPTFYGFSSGEQFHGFYGFNMIEELEAPGEYYVDKKNKKIYFIPYDENDLNDLSLSVIEEPLAAVENTSDIYFENITFECTRGMGVYVEGGSDIHFTSCTFRNIGTAALCFGKGVKTYTNFRGETVTELTSRALSTFHAPDGRNCGKDHVVDNCEIYNTGSGGIFMGGGSRLTLERGNNRITNCIIHNVNRWNKTYSPGVLIDGVGNVIDHTEISDCAGPGVLLNGNDHIIEYNIISNVSTEGEDMGGFYYGRNPSERGNILRYNYFHHIGNGGVSAKKAGVYHDDGACGMKVYGNIFYKAGDFAVELGGGSDINYTNNIFIDVPIAFFVDNRLQNWGKEFISDSGIYRERLNAVNIDKLPYSDAYPDLAKYWTDSLGVPKRNNADLNIFYNVPQLIEGSKSWLKFANNLITNIDPGFVSAGKMDFRLKKDSEVFTALPGFQNIPFEKIGRQAKDSEQGEENCKTKRLYVYTNKIINDDFLGVNGVYHGFAFMPEQAARGMNGKDREREFSRIKNMGLNIARTWYRPDWACGSSLYNSFDFKSEKMEAFCRWLDKMKELNVDIALQAGWWITKDTYYGNEQPDTVKDSARYAEWVRESLNYLINEKGFTNIKYLVLFTEPLNYNSGIVPAGTTQQDYYEKICRSVHNELVKAGLRDKLKFVGPNSGSTRNAQWVGWAMEKMNDIIDIYSWHAYNATRLDREYGGWKDITEIGKDKIAKTGKPFWIDEYGAGYPDESVRFQPDYGNYLAQCVSAFTNSGAQTSLIWLLMSQLYPAPLEHADSNDSFYNGVHRWGLTRWPHDSQPDSTKPYPAWYAFSMMSRYLPGRNGTEVLQTANEDSLYITSIKLPGKGISILVVNASHKAQKFEVKFDIKQELTLYRHLYDPAKVTVAEDAEIIKKDKDYSLTGDIFGDELPARGTAVYTTIE